MPKTNIETTTVERVSDISQQIGMLLMTAALTLSVFDFGQPQDKRVVLPNRPALALAGENDEASNPIRREREEAAPHFISYSEVQRTPSRSGR